MRPTVVTVSSATTSAAIPVDNQATVFNLGLVGVVSNTATWKVQYTFDNIYDSTVVPTWIDHATLTGKTANADGTLTTPCRAVRLNVTAWTSGTVTLTVIQGRSN